MIPNMTGGVKGEKASFNQFWEKSGLFWVISFP